MKKIKFKIEYIPLSDSQIERHKNFEQLMAAYSAHPHPTWKDRFFNNKFLVYIGGIITGAIVVGGLWLGMNQLGRNEIAENIASSTQEVIGEKEAISNSDYSYSLDSSLLMKDDTVKKVVEQEVASEDSNIKTLAKESGYSKTSIQKQKESLGLIAESGDKALLEKNKTSVGDTSLNFSTSEPVTLAKAESQEDSEMQQQKNNEQLLKDESSEMRDSVASENLNSKRSIDSLIVPDYLTQETKDSSVQSIKTQPDKGISFDSVYYTQEPVFADTNYVGTPGDTSKNKSLTLPKIDLNDEWDASKNALSKIADSVGRKTGGFFSGIFKRDSLKQESSKETQEEVAENAPPDTFKHRFAQVSFVSPLSTDGVNAQEYEHNISFNVLQGYTGALDGVEIGGLANIEKGYVKGVQFAGLTNFAFGDVTASQFAGLVNYGKSLQGTQFGGLVNVAMGDVRGLQAAGVLNFAKGTLSGLQLGGVLNLSAGNDSTKSWQLGGVGNVSFGDIDGGQIAGVFNVSNKQHGIQAGVINVSKRLKGFQLGLINIADSLDGEALGLISISKNGIHHLDVFGSEILYANVGLKLGSPHIYTIFATGVAPVNTSTVRIGFGLGAGGHASLDRAFFNFDGMCWTIHDNTLRDWNAINLWNQIRLMAGYHFTNGLAFYGGPTANVQVYDNKYSAIAPYKIYENAGNTNVDGWIGFVLGLQFF